MPDIGLNEVWSWNARQILGSGIGRLAAVSSFPEDICEGPARGITRTLEDAPNDDDIIEGGGVEAVESDDVFC